MVEAEGDWKSLWGCACPAWALPARPGAWLVLGLPAPGASRAAGPPWLPALLQTQLLQLPLQVTAWAQTSCPPGAAGFGGPPHQAQSSVAPALPPPTPALRLHLAGVFRSLCGGASRQCPHPSWRCRC